MDELNLVKDIAKYIAGKNDDLAQNTSLPGLFEIGEDEKHLVKSYYAIVTVTSFNDYYFYKMFILIDQNNIVLMAERTLNNQQSPEHFPRLGLREEICNINMADPRLYEKCNEIYRTLREKAIARGNSKRSSRQIAI